MDPSSHDWSKFEKIGAITQNEGTAMKVIGENIMYNGVTISQDFYFAMEAFEKKDYKNFGFGIGKALSDSTATDNDYFLY